MDTPEHKDNAVSQVETDVISATENTAGNDKNASLPCIEQPVETVEEIVDNNSATEVAEKIFVASDDEKNLLEEEKSDDLDKKSDIAQENVAKNAGKRQKNYYALSREELLDELKELLVEPAYENIRTAAETIKQAFYKKQNTENEQAEKIIDAVEAEFKELLTKYRDLKAGMNAKIEEQKLKNLERKQAVLAKLEELTSSADDLSQTIPAFRKLQSEWKKIEQVPQSMVTEIWKQYSRYQEKFYDLIKINNDLREYDFKKNLEAKSALCEATEKLEEEQDAVLAFQQLQKMHEEWREIGPVSREFREEIWERFKNASSKINKKHQAYFESLKEIEEKNLRLKTELCEKIEAINFEELKTFKQWDAKKEEVDVLQNEWRKIGFASRKADPKIFKRFRAACNNFFKLRSEFMKKTKEELAQNMEKFKVLVAQAEELKNSTDWKTTGDKIAELRKEWKKVGAMSRKYTDVLWKKFTAACDYFFEQREANTSEKRNEEAENLKLKNEIINKIEAFEPSGNKDEDIAVMKEFRAQYNKIGFVPFKEKAKLQEIFTKIVDKKFYEICGSKGKDAKSGGTKEKSRSPQYSELKRQLRTYENNIEFLTSSSKNGNQLLEQMNKKVEELKAQIAKIEAKLEK